MDNQNSLRKNNAAKIIIIFRYVSLFITSYFYVIAINQHTLGRKVFIVSGMTVTSLIMNYLYEHNKGEKQKIGFLIGVETIGNIVLLILSGGFHSAYIWYVLNTVLVAAIEMGTIMTWVNMMVYVTSLIFSNSFSNEQGYKSANLVLSDINIILGVVLVTGSIEMFVRYAKAIAQKNSEIIRINEQLQQSNRKVEETLEYVVKVYEVIHLFSTQNDSNHLIELILGYTEEVLNIKGTLFIKIEEQKDYSIYSKALEEANTDKLAHQIIKSYEEQTVQCDRWEIEVEDDRFTALLINYRYKNFGILAVRNSQELEKLNVIVQLAGMLFQRFRVEELNDILIIEREQNRIANEMHDSVLQKLFALSCNLYTISKSAEKMQLLQIVQQINTNRASVNLAMRELKETIYGLSSEKGGSNRFQDKIDSYIKEMQNLHSIQINLKCEGSLRLLTIKQQISLYRIICEGIANAIKHGKASVIDILLSVNFRHIKIAVQDNGIGFDPKGVREEGRMGLGIKNMYDLAAVIGGTMTIRSDKGEGTTLEMTMQVGEEADRKKEII